MDKKDLKPFKVTITFDKNFADYYDEAIEQLKGEGFLDARNPHKASDLPLWEDWNLNHEDNGTWTFTATVYGISKDDAMIATNIAYPSVDCAALRHLVHTEVKAISDPVLDAVTTVKHAFLYIFDKETASHFMPSDKYDRDLEAWLYNSEFLSGYSFRETRSCCKDQGDCHIALSGKRIELYIIPKWIDITGTLPLAQAHRFLGGTVEYNDEVMLKNSLVSVAVLTLNTPALPKRLDSEAEECDNVNDGEFVRVIIDGEPATYSYKFEVEQRFVLDHTDELSLPENELRWWRNHGVTDANIGDWQMHEAFLVYKIREGEAFAGLIK